MSLEKWLGDTAKRWRELHGESDWNGLLDPFDLGLRRTVIRYGEMAQATYDAFNRESVSPHAGLSMFSRRSFFRRAQLPDHAAAYRVTRFLYATSSVAVAAEAFMLRSVSPRGRRCRESNWIGYVAVATDGGAAALGRRDVVVAWRGTIQKMEWIDDLEFVMAPPKGILGDVEAPDAMVHRGWLSMYTSSDPESSHNKDSARDQVLKEVARLVDMYGDEEMSITVTGHSLGAALATLNAFDIAANGHNVSRRRASPFPVTAFAFASPRVGGHGFKRRFAAAAALRLLRVRNARDVVTRYPAEALHYADVGAELAIDTWESPYLRRPGNELVWHNLECYLHGVAGARGGGGGSSFELVVERDVALANKTYGALCEEHGVPAGWWVPSNRGMVRGDDGRWTLMDCEEDEDCAE
uniref:Phospholipase A1 n=1 Tax=Leersia perrieri TaxID=77586 RepID=A0A0D9WK08_9ORYZ